MDRQSVKLGAVSGISVLSLLCLGAMLLNVGRSGRAEDAPSAVKPPKAEAPKADAPKTDGQKFKLAYRFQLGQVVNSRVRDTMKIHIQRNGAEEIVENTSESEKHFKVTAVTPDGNGDLELTIDRVHMSARFNDAAEEIFKSDDPKFHHAKFRHILATVGTPQATITFGPTGRIIKVIANKAAVAEAAKKESDASETYLSPLPDNPIAVGENWVERFELRVDQQKLSVGIKMARYYKLAAVKDGLATIEFTTSVISPVSDPEIEAQLIQRRTRGQLLFDIAQGMVISRAVVVDRATIIEPFGAKSSMSAESTYEEKLVPAKVAAKPAETTTK